MATLKDKIAALEPLVAGKPHAMFALARMMQRDGQKAKAFELCQAALSLAPGDGRLEAEVNAFINDKVAPSHFTLIHDTARNAAYETALRRAVTPDSRVLEIGCGSGLLAMMAARAGAAAVVTCEVFPPLASKATEIIARNGYSGRVRVIAEHSSMLDVEADLGGRADILVSEIVGSTLLDESVLAAHEHAVRCLLKPGARVIPARGAIRVALGYHRRDMPDLTNISGFDLSPFASLRPRRYGLFADDEKLTLRSESADLFAFDFASPFFCPPAQACLDCVSAGGEINGVAQWITLTLDETTHYENQPGAGNKSHWAVQFYPFSKTIRTVAGQNIRIFGSHDRERLTIWAETR